MHYIERMATREHALNQVIELALLLNQDMEREFARLGLSVARTHLLWELQQRGTSTQRELAEALKVTARNITGLIDGLVATGFVTREPHPSDRRATLIQFTEHGTDVMATMARDHQELSDQLFKDMPQFPAFTEGMDHLIGRLRRAVSEAEVAQKKAEAAQKEKDT
jgi:DNA-binding MarR family transcriptional regulator